MATTIFNTALFNMMAMTYKIKTKGVERIIVIADRGDQVAKAEDQTIVKRDKLAE